MYANEDEFMNMVGFFEMMSEEEIDQMNEEETLNYVNKFFQNRKAVSIIHTNYGDLVAFDDGNEEFLEDFMEQ